jgi:hypothetical protein
MMLVPVLLCGAGGCTLSPHSQGPSWVDYVRAGATLDANTVLIETALIEHPLGDPFLCHELWQDTDELLVGLQCREALHDNGLRVGQLIGTPSVGFQTLLLSPRSCANPARLLVPSGKLIPLYTGAVVPHSSFEVVLDGGKTELEADQVRFGFDMVATLTSDGRTRLAFAPKVETGERLLPFQASPEQSTWVMRIERPSRKFAELGWEVTLAPGQYLAIGCIPEMTASLGQSAFVDDDARRQRLLVIRTNRAAAVSGDCVSDDSLRGGPAPLAVQAAQPVFGGKDR